MTFYGVGIKTYDSSYLFQGVMTPSPESTQDLRLLRWVITGLTYFGDRAFSVALPRAWSRLPVELRRSTPLFTVQSQKENVFRLDALALSVIATATWLAGWLSVTAGIVSKRLNLSENFFDRLIAPS